MTPEQRETLNDVQRGYDYTEVAQSFLHDSVVVDCYLGSSDLKFQTTVTIRPDGTRSAGGVS